MTREDGYAGLSLARLGSDSLEIMTFGARGRVDVRPHIGGVRGRLDNKTLYACPVTWREFRSLWREMCVTDVSDTSGNCQIPVK